MLHTDENTTSVAQVSQELNNDHSLVTFKFKMSHDAKITHTKTVLLDFSGVTREQLIDLCSSAQSIVVKLQRLLRDMGENVATDPSTFREVNVLQDLINGTKRSRLPSDEIAIRTLSKKFGITEDELRSFLHHNPEMLQEDNSGDQEATE